MNKAPGAQLEGILPRRDRKVRRLHGTSLHKPKLRLRETNPMIFRCQLQDNPHLQVATCEWVKLWKPYKWHQLRKIASSLPAHARLMLFNIRVRFRQINSQATIVPRLLIGLAKE